MAEYGGFVDSTEYTAAEYSQLVIGDTKNIARDYEEELEVSQGTGLQVIVGSGQLGSKGRYYLQTTPSTDASPLTLSIDAATTGFLRKDRIVIEFNITAGTFAAKVSKGTEAAANPTAPALVDTSTVWEFPLAIVNIDGNTIDSIEDSRVIGSREVHGYTASKVMVSDENGTLQASTADSDDLANIGDISTNTANIATNTSDIATNTSDISDLQTRYPVCKAHNTAVQTSGTYAQFNTEDIDSDAMFDPSVDNTLFTIPSGQGGDYLISFTAGATFSKSANLGTFNTVKIRINSTNYDFLQIGLQFFTTVTVNEQCMSATHVFELNAGDTIKIEPIDSPSTYTTYALYRNTISIKRIR